jgi:hypothetical protein
MKKIMTALMCVCLFCFSLVGCTNGNGNSNSGADVPIVYVVTFETQDGIIRKEVEDGKALADIPALPTEIGYTFSWSVSDFSCITKDMMVRLIKTANEYFISYDLEGLKGNDGKELLIESQKVAFGSFVTLAQPSRDCYEFMGWVDEDGNPFADGLFKLGRSVTLKAIWEEDNHWSGRA